MRATAKEVSQQLTSSNKEELSLHLQMYYNDEIDQKIKKVQQKMKERKPQYYYNTLNSAFAGEQKQSDNLPGSPTEQRAMSLLNLWNDRKAKVWLLQRIKELVPKLEDKFGLKWELVRYKLGCSKYNSRQEMMNNITGISNYKIKKLAGRRSELIDPVVEEFEQLLAEYQKRLT